MRYRFAGTPKKLTIGPYPAIDLAVVRRRAQEALGALAGGIDPAGVKRASKVAARAGEAAHDRLSDVAGDFIEKHAKRKNGAIWAAETERLLRVEILPKLGAKRIGDVSRVDVHNILDDVIDRGSPVTANRVLAVLRKLYNWSIERGVVMVSPVDRIKAPTVENSRDRVLSNDEIRSVWQAFERIGWPFGAVGQLLLLTGARRTEVAASRWSEFDTAARSWTIAAERSKNGIAHTIPLSDKALEILSTLPHIASKSGFVFTTNGRVAVRGFSSAKKCVDAAIVTANGARIAPWTFHDLRRSAASGMASIGIAPHVVEAVLNHRSGTIKGVAKVYNRYSYATEKRAALDAWARRLEAIVSGEDDEGKVVAFVRK